MDKKKVIYICIIVVCICIGIWYFFCSGNNSPSESSDNYNRIQQDIGSIESDNQYSRADIQSATGEVESASKQLENLSTAVDGATDTVNNLQDNNRTDQATIAECNDLLAESRSNIERARQLLATAQTADQPTSSGEGTSNSST